MEVYSDIRKLLLAKRAEHETEIQKIDGILASLGGSKAKPGPKPGKGMSAAGRAAISRAQKLRWAKLKAKSGPKPGKKRKMSRAGRLAIARAKKAWWAKKKAGK